MAQTVESIGEETAGAGGGGPQLLQPRGRGRLGETWLARFGGELVAAKRVALGPGLEGDRVRELARGLLDLRHPALVPVLAVVTEQGSAWVVSELDRGVPLRRLLAVASLTPGQAALVAADLIVGLRALAEARLQHGSLHDNNVHLGIRGRARLVDFGLVAWVSEAASPGHWEAADRVAVARLLAGLLPRGRPGRGWAVADAVAFQEAVRELPHSAAGDSWWEALARVELAAQRLLKGDEAERAAGELAAMVATLGGGSDPLSPHRDVPTFQQGAGASISASSEPAPAPPPAVQGGDAWQQPALPLTALVRAIGAVVALGALGLALWAGVSWLEARPHSSSAVTSGTPHALGPAPSASPTPIFVPSATPTPSPTPRPVPAFAPGSAGPVTGVVLEPLEQSCSPGASCPVRVYVRLSPQPGFQQVAWSYQVFDRCTGAVTQLPGLSLEARPGWLYVYGTSYLQLPAARSLALVAVTSAPAAAASSPLAVPEAGGESC